MRIVHFVENLARGGLERTVIDLIRAQREAGHDCRVVCLFEEGSLAAELQAEGVSVTACGKRGGADLAALRRARRWIAQAPGAVLHTHNAVAHYHAVAAAWGLPLARVINTRHGMGTTVAGGRREWLYRRSMRLTDHAVAVCEAARARFDDQGVRPRAGLVTIPNGIRIDRFQARAPEHRERLRQALALPADSQVIGTVGRLQPVKDQATLIRAFARVHARMPQAALVIIGDGALRATLEATAVEEGVAAAVHFLGDRSDVEHWLPGMDVFALSSLSEGYSIALLEACAAALPIVATDVGGNREIVRPGDNGWLVPAGDAGALAAALGEALGDPAAAAGRGAAGREWVLAEGSFRTMAERYQRLYAGAALPAQGREP